MSFHQVEFMDLTCFLKQIYYQQKFILHKSDLKICRLKKLESKWYFWFPAKRLYINQSLSGLGSEGCCPVTQQQSWSLSLTVLNPWGFRRHSEVPSYRKLALNPRCHFFFFLIYFPLSRYFFSIIHQIIKRQWDPVVFQLAFGCTILLKVKVINK